jgi:hypothetical protein
MLILAAQFRGRYYFFGPLKDQEEVDRVKTRLEEAWQAPGYNPGYEVFKLNDYQSCLGLAEGHDVAILDLNNIKGLCS